MKRTLLMLLLALTSTPILATETNQMITVDGVTYSNVIFGAVTPYAVSIRYDHGIASIPLAKLSPELQNKFGYDPAKAARYRAEELDRLRISREKQEADERESQHAQQLARNALAFTGQVVNVVPEGVVIHAKWEESSRLLSDGRRVPVFTKHDVQVLLTGHPKASSLANGDKIMCDATREGTIKIRGKVLQRWVWITDKPNGW